MGSFWDFLASYVGPAIGILVGLVILGYVLTWLVGGFVDLGQWFTLESYRALRYERKGICGICKLPYQEWVSRQADQTYGPDRQLQGVCPNGHVSIVRGNKRFADWADF